MRASVAGAKNASDIQITVVADESTGLSKDSLTFGSEDYTNTMLARYNELLDLINEYGKDDVVDAQTGAVTHSAAYLGYQAEAKRVLEEMLSLGLAERSSSGIIEPKASLIVDYVEIPELVASGGNISVDTDDFMSSGGSGTLKANGSPEIKLINNTNLMTKVNAITVEEAGGKLIYNGTEISGTSAAEFNKNISSLNQGAAANFQSVEAAGSGSVGTIDIKGRYDGNSINYSYTEAGKTIAGSFRPMANIQVQGNIYAKEGSVSIYSKADSILIQGKTAQDAVAISAANVNLEAGQSITQGYTDGIVSIGGDVREQYASQYDSIIENNGSVDGTYEMSQVGSAPVDKSKASGSYIAGGSVYINASDINVNGIVQSGYGDYYANISDLKTQSRIKQINDAYTGDAISDSVVTTGEQYKIIDGGAYWDATDQCYKCQLNVYYNPSTQKILVQDVDAGGGRIYLTGRISSTGNGKIICLDGVSNISVNNTTSYALQLGDLVTHDVQGLVSITDTAKNTLTEITSSNITVKTIGAEGAGTTTAFNPTTGYDYAPQTGLSYTWTSGMEDTQFNRYKQDFGEGGWGLWDTGISTKELAEWHKQHPIEPSEPGQSYQGERDSGEIIRNTAATASYDNYVTIASTKLAGDTVIESERKYASGLWGYHKHYEVIWTESTGTVYTYDASVRADNSFNINFVGYTAENANINITSGKDINLTGNIGNTELYKANTNTGTALTEKGTVSISSSAGSLLQSNGAIYAANVSLAAAKDMENISIVAGDTVKLSALNLMNSHDDRGQNSLDIKVQGAGVAKGNVVLGNMGSVTSDAGGSSMPINSAGEKTTGVTGSVTLAISGSEGNISQAADSLIVADRIDLTTTNGSIYGQKQADGTVTALQLYAGQQPLGSDTLSASVNAKAKGDITLEQVAGNMRLGRVYSGTGDVSLTVAQGSMEDALPYVANDRGTAEEMLARWRSLGIIEGDSSDAENAAMLAAKNFQNTSAKLGAYEAWDAYALLYAIQDKIVNPDTSALPETSDKDPNVIGHNITINVADSVGINSGVVKKIDTNTLLDKDANGNYINLENLKALSKLDASTKVTWEIGDNGHNYAVYTETIPIGMQQTNKTVTTGQGAAVVNGKLTIQSAASSGTGGATLNGDIYVQGREQKLVEGAGTTITQNKDLYVHNILTNVGEVTLTSLGGIYNAASVNTPAITGQSLIITTAGGSIGTDANYLTTKLLGSDKTKDGLSAIATGGIYVDQQGNEALLVRNVSSGGDIYLSSATDILMGVVNGTDAVNYIRAENGNDIVLEARGGSIGEVEYVKDAEGNYVLDAAGNKVVARDTNQGIRILNDARASSSAQDDDVSNV
ncbi:MAG: hypothetical protein ACI3WU_09050, partial [Phascolarctobacterium sp.]